MKFSKYLFTALIFLGGCCSRPVIKTQDVTLPSPVLQDSFMVLPYIMDIDSSIQYMDLYNKNVIQRISDSTYIPIKSNKGTGRFYPKKGLVTVTIQPDSVKGRVDIPVIKEEIPWYKRLWEWLKNVGIGYVIGSLIAVVIIVLVRRK